MENSYIANEFIFDLLESRHLENHVPCIVETHDKKTKLTPEKKNIKFATNVTISQ